MRSFKSPIIALGLLALPTAGIYAESPAPASPPAPQPTTSVTKLPIGPVVGPRSMMPPQASLTSEENAILREAHAELQKDPEIQELNSVIKSLMEKRAKLAEEKLEKISPEAAAILQKAKANQEKMQAERRAQFEAMQAKRKAQQESDSSQAASPKTEPAPTPTPASPTPAVPATSP